MIESLKQQKVDTNTNFLNSDFLFDRCSRAQVEVREIKNIIIRQLCLILCQEKCGPGINCSKYMVYHLELLKIFTFLERNPAKVCFNYVFRKIQSKSKYYQFFQQSETFKSLATFHFSKLSTAPSTVKPTIISNHALTNSIKQVQLYNNPVSLIQCLGCIGKFYENFPYYLQKAQQNYIILDMECLKESNMMKSAVCAALNNSFAYIIITKRFLKIDYCYKVEGLQNVGEVEQKIRGLISQSLLYMIPDCKKIEQRIQKIPFYKQKPNKNENFSILRITLCSVQNKQVYINLKKDTNSEKEWNVSAYTLLKHNQMLEINGPHVYNFILNRYYCAKRFSSVARSKHNGIKCYAPHLHEQIKNVQEVDKYKKVDNNSSKDKNTDQSKKDAKQVKQSESKRLEQLIELGPYKHHTIITISKSKNSNTLSQIKSILTEAKIEYQVKQIALSWMTKKTPMVYILSHTCPSQLINKLLFSCNKSGNLSFLKPGRYITVRDSAFFAANREEEFKKVFYSIILLDGPEKAYKRSFEMSNMDDGSYNKHVEGPVNYAFKKVEDAILAFCWFLAQDVRKLEFRKP